MPPSRAAQVVAQMTGVSRDELYRYAMTLKGSR